MFISSVLLMLCSSVHCGHVFQCSLQCDVDLRPDKEMCDSYMDLTIDMIVRAKHNIPICPKIRMSSKRTFDGIQPIDCAEVLQKGYNQSGIYEIRPISRLTEGRPVTVYCDMDTDRGGWTVIQRRGNFGSSKKYFYQTWESYKEGFGDLEKDFWLGNDNIFALTNQKLYSVRFDLMDLDKNKAYALYDKFWIDDERNQYALYISIYSGHADDSMTSYYNNNQFSTKDHENNSHGCAKKYRGAWWYGSFLGANLNGLYYKEKQARSTDGISWVKWKDSYETLEWTEIKVRPKNYNPSFESKIIPY